MVLFFCGSDLFNELFKLFLLLRFFIFCFGYFRESMDLLLFKESDDKEIVFEEFFLGIWFLGSCEVVRMFDSLVLILLFLFFLVIFISIVCELLLFILWFFLDLGVCSFDDCFWFFCYGWFFLLESVFIFFMNIICLDLFNFVFITVDGFDIVDIVDFVLEYILGFRLSRCLFRLLYFWIWIVGIILFWILFLGLILFFFWYLILLLEVDFWIS